MDLLKLYDRTRYLVLFGGEKYDSIYSKIRYLIRYQSRFIQFFTSRKNNGFL